MAATVWLRRVAAVFTARGDRGSLGRLLDQVTLTVGIGNLDLNAKNISLLHPLDAPPTLAPAYDVVPLRHHDNDGATALSVAGEYRHAALTVDHLVAEAESWGLRRTRPRVAGLLERLHDAPGGETPDPRAHRNIRGLMLTFTENLPRGRPAG